MCIGKTFAEIVVKLVVLGLISKFDFYYADPKMKTERKPILNADMDIQPSVVMKITLQKSFDSI